MPRLYVSDMDGTLLGADSKVSARTAEIISRLSREGALFTVATARTPATVEPLLAATHTWLPAIVMTGAALWDRKSGRFIEATLLPAEAEAAAVKEFQALGINPFIYVLTSESHLTVYHHGPLTRREENFYLDRRGLALKHFDFNRPDIYTTPLSDVILLLGIGDASKVMSLAERLNLDNRLSVSAYCDPVCPSVAYIEVFAAGVSKRAAVERLARQVGATGVTVYGDNLNDLSMMEAADDSVAMGNAVAEVKARASRTIGLNVDDAVALDVERLYESERRETEKL